LKQHDPEPETDYKFLISRRLNEKQYFIDYAGNRGSKLIKI